jgi:hypothetical protein
MIYLNRKGFRMANGVKVVNGFYNLNSADLVGRTVGEVMDDAAYSRLLSLNGDENTDVKSGDSSDYQPVDNDFVLNEGDTLRFSRSGGTKG